MPVAAVNGLQLYYEQQGQGEDLILLMGHGLSHKFWGDQIPAYSERFRCTAFDNRGVGGSSVTPRGFSIEDMAEDAFGLMDALGIAQAHVAGLSMGGSIAIAMALQGPERVKSLSLHSTLGRIYPLIKLRYQVLIGVAKVDDPDLWANTAVLTAYAGDYINKNSGLVEPDIARRRRDRQAMSLEQVEGLIGHYIAFSTYDPFDRLPEIHIPTLITVGTADNVTPPAYAEDLNKQIPGSELIVFPGAPHRVTLFARDEFNRRTMEFLVRQSKG